MLIVANIVNRLCAFGKLWVLFCLPHFKHIGKGSLGGLNGVRVLLIFKQSGDGFFLGGEIANGDIFLCGRSGILVIFQM